MSILVGKIKFPVYTYSTVVYGPFPCPSHTDMTRLLNPAAAAAAALNPLSHLACPPYYPTTGLRPSHIKCNNLFCQIYLPNPMVYFGEENLSFSNSINVHQQNTTWTASGQRVLGITSLNVLRP